MKILFAGGGTLGPVTPLLATAEAIKQLDPSVQMFWVGTTTGPEQNLVEVAGIPFYKLNSAKLRRYASAKNLLDVFKFIGSFFRAHVLLFKLQPQVIVSAGGYVAVPLVWAGFMQRCKIVVHQQDLIPGLANKLCVPLANKISVAFPELLVKFSQKKTVYVGNPVRAKFLEVKSSSIFKSESIHYFGLDTQIPVVLVLGGGTGGLGLNQLLAKTLPMLLAVTQVIHLTGVGKDILGSARSPRYRAFEFLGADIFKAFAAANVVVTRAGLGTLSEIAVLEIPAIIVPMPQSHQEANAQYFAEHGAGIVVDQGIEPEDLVGSILGALNDEALRQNMQSALDKIMPKHASQTLAKLILGLKK